MNIRNLFEQNISSVENVMKSFNWADKEAYAHFLAQTYYYTKHSTALLGRGARRLGSSFPELKARFLEHVKEEKGHHLLAKSDLEKLGFTLDQLPEYEETAGFYARQYHYIDTFGTPSLFGYIVQLEGIAVKFGSQLQTVLKKSYPVGAYEFVRVHAEEDVDHLETAFRFIETLPARDLKVIEKNFLESCALYSQIVTRAASKNSDYYGMVTINAA